MMRIVGFLRLSFVLLIEFVSGGLRFLGVLADAVSPFFSIINHRLDQQVLVVFPLWRLRFAFWGLIISLVTLVAGIYLAEKKPTWRSPGRTVAAGFLAVVVALILSHLYLGLFAEFTDYMQTTGLEGPPHEWRVAFWSAVLLLLYTATFALITLGLTFVGMFAYHDAIQKLKAE